MNLLRSVSIKNLWNTSLGVVGSTAGSTANSALSSTGDAAGTTAGSTSSLGDSSTPGGYPYASTGFDMQGFEGALIIADVSGSTATVVKAAYSDVSSTVSSTSWTDLPNIYEQSGTESTAFHSVPLDITKPTKRYLAAIVQVPSSSAVMLGIKVIQYGAAKAPTAQSTGYLVSGGGSVFAGSTA